MRGLKHSTPPWNPPRPDGVEHAQSVFITGQASESAKRGVWRLLLRVGRMIVFAGPIRLPQFDHRIRHRLAVAIQYPACELDSLALRVRTGQTGAGVVRRQREMEKGTDRLIGSVDQIHTLFLARRGVTAAQHDVKTVTQCPSL